MNNVILLTSKEYSYPNGWIYTFNAGNVTLNTLSSTLITYHIFPRTSHFIEEKCVLHQK